MKRSLLDIAVLISAVHVVTTYGISGSYCIGPSMEPALKTGGQVVLIDNFSYLVLGKTYNNGDVVLSTCPYDANKLICKRVTAVAGEHVQVRKHIFIETITIPRGHVWLAGDNASNSTDSRTYGPVPLGLLRGRAFLKCSFDNPFIENKSTKKSDTKE